MIDALIDHEAVAAALSEPDGWRGSLDGRPTFFEKMLFAKNGYRVDLHRFVGADDADCFHSHPATAIRMVLSGGYIEEFSDGSQVHVEPGYIGIVTPEMTHRVHQLLNGEESVSLWVRTPKTHKTKLVGNGWQKQHA